MFSEEKTPTESNSSFLAFAGGFIGAMTHYITSMHILLNIHVDELLNFTIHSFIGGAVMFVLKLAGDGILYLVQRYAQYRKEKKDKQKQTEVQPSTTEEKQEEKTPTQNNA